MHGRRLTRVAGVRAAGVAALAIVVSVVVAGPGQGATAAALLVPTQYPRIQAAVDAASPGDTILVRPGTYAEQLVVAKDLTIRGAAAQVTTIAAPPALALDSFGRTTIVKITGGATVSVTGLTISGPGSTACAGGTLNAGIWVIGGATLDIRSARVLHIHDTPRQFCNRAGTAIAVGSFILGEVGHANVHNVAISDYQGNGVSVFEPGSTAIVTDSVIDASTTAADSGVFTGGVEVGDGAVAVVKRNLIANARCVGTNALGPCGGDPFTTFQASGINSGPALPPGTGTEFSDNIISGNDVGIYLAFADNCCTVRRNVIVNSVFFGVVIQDSTNEETRNVIVGGPVGVAVAADAVDSVGTLHGDVILRQSVAATQELECCGFTATLVRTP